MNWELAFAKLEKEFRKSRSTAAQLALDLGAGSLSGRSGADMRKDHNEETEQIILKCKE
jgi:hypothetical protein